MKTTVKNSLYFLFSAGLVLGFASCADMGKKSPTISRPSASMFKGGSSLAKYRAYDNPASLPSNPKAVRVKVSTGNQMVYVMEGNKPLLVTPVSVGKASSPTPHGSFRIYFKDADRRAQTHGYAVTPDGQSTYYTKKKSAPAGSRKIGTPMPYWTEFKSGYGFHTGWMKDQPCTHGCIRMHENVAPKFFRIVGHGTPVHIASSQPEDATLGRNVRRPIDASPLPDYPLSLMKSSKIFTYHKTPRFN